MFVIKRAGPGLRYVNRPGSHHSYTNSLERAQKFATRERADLSRCSDNEFVVDVDTLLRN